MTKKLKDISVLIVEDEPALNDAYATILRAESITVDTSFDGAEALEKVGKNMPDIILLDLRMPNVDGLEFLRKFADVPNNRKAKVVIFSNFDEQEDIDKAFALGAVRYMLKAWVSPKELVKLIKETAP
jgi:CheY-like chemotaxis protein